MAKKTSWIILAACCVLIKVFSFFPQAIERYYSNGIFPVTSAAQRLAFGWLPFSVGDIFYFAAFIVLAYNVFLFLKATFTAAMTRQRLVRSLKRVLFVSLIVYISFNALWGLNYNRMPMEKQMGFPVQEYTTSSLKTVVVALINKLNGFENSQKEYKPSGVNKQTIIGEAVETYGVVVKPYPALRYRFASCKPSLYSYAGNYLGFTGYYNPFSGEAQANTTVPAIVQPFTTCHEIGHQLGYAKENEANFAGFLAAHTSEQAAFRYSAYFAMYEYAIRDLYIRDSLGARSLHRRLNLPVKLDLIHVRQFYHRYDSPFGPLISRLYGRFLRANEQPEGLHSYNEVVAMLLAYYKKTGTL